MQEQGMRNINLIALSPACSNGAISPRACRLASPRVANLPPVAGLGLPIRYANRLCSSTVASSVPARSALGALLARRCSGSPLATPHSQQPTRGRTLRGLELQPRESCDCPYRARLQRCAVLCPRRIGCSTTMRLSAGTPPGSQPDFEARKLGNRSPRRDAVHGPGGGGCSCMRLSAAAPSSGKTPCEADLRRKADRARW